MPRASIAQAAAGIVLAALLLLPLGGCGRTPKAPAPDKNDGEQPTKQAVLPWTPAEQQTPLSYDAYFSRCRPYADSTVCCAPRFGTYSVTREGTGLYVKNDATGKRLWRIPGLDEFLPMACDDRRIYGVDGETELISVDYFGGNRRVLYTDETGRLRKYARIGSLYLAENTLFFVAGCDSGWAICRKYLPDGHTDVLQAGPEELTLSAPVSNCEITWQTSNSAFFDLYEDLHSDPLDGAAGMGDSGDTAQTMGAVESSYQVYPYMQHYYNAMTGERRELATGIYYLPRTQEDIDKNGNCWWLD